MVTDDTVTLFGQEYTRVEATYIYNYYKSQALLGLSYATSMIYVKRACEAALALGIDIDPKIRVIAELEGWL